jgi:GNAT superfamily N-acetyltransferase
VVSEDHRVTDSTLQRIRPGIQRLTLDDLPDCLVLAQDRDWPAEENKWRLLLEVGTAYGLRDEAGDLVGTTIVSRFQADLAAISMVLVAARYGRRGLGGTLMRHALAEAGEATVFLNATEYGRPLYERLGFVPVGMTYVHVGDFTLPTRQAGRLGRAGGSGSRPAEPADLAAIRTLDAQVNGTDRTQLIDRLPAFAEQLRVIERHGEITGYAGAWRNVDDLVIGPVIAEVAADAMTLIADLAARACGPVRVDVDGRHPRLRTWATEHGLVPVFQSTVMVHAGRSLPGDRDRWYVPVMQALG